MSNPTLSVVIPAFNAAAHLRDRLGFLRCELTNMDFSSEVIVVDDGSTDETWSLVQDLGVRSVQLNHNTGKFGALRAGMRAAKGHCCVFTDADVPFDLNVLKSMVDLTLNQGFHVIAGDRTLPGSVYDREMSFSRRVATNVFRHTVRLLVTGELPDTQCGFKGFRRDVAKALFPLIQEDGFAGDVELLYIALKYNLAIRRVPVQLVNKGSTSLRPFRDGGDMLLRTTRLRGRYRRGEYESATLRKIAESSLKHQPAKSGMLYT